MHRLLDTQDAVTLSLDAQAHEEDASNVQRWEPGLKLSRTSLKLSRTTGYSLTGGQRHTRAMQPMRLRNVTRKLNVPAWHKPYGEALLTTDAQTLSKLLAAAQVALFERLLELTGQDAPDEREDISSAIDIVLSLKVMEVDLPIWVFDTDAADIN
jgi:hypothetical protein